MNNNFFFKFMIFFGGGEFSNFGMAILKLEGERGG